MSLQLLRLILKFSTLEFVSIRFIQWESNKMRRRLILSKLRYKYYISQIYFNPIFPFTRNHIIITKLIYNIRLIVTLMWSCVKIKWWNVKKWNPDNWWCYRGHSLQSKCGFYLIPIPKLKTAGARNKFISIESYIINLLPWTDANNVRNWES